MRANFSCAANRGTKVLTERQKDKKTERQKDRKTERRQDRKTLDKY